MKKQTHFLLLLVFLTAAILMAPSAFAQEGACTPATHQFVENTADVGYYYCTGCDVEAKYIESETHLNSSIDTAVASDVAKDKVLLLDAGEYEIGDYIVNGTVTIIGQGKNETIIRRTSGRHMFTIGVGDLEPGTTTPKYCELTLANVSLDSDQGERQCINAKYNSKTYLYNVYMGDTKYDLDLLVDNGNLASGSVCYTGGLTTYVYAYNVEVENPVQLNANPRDAYYVSHPTFTSYVEFYYEGGNIGTIGVKPQNCVRGGDTLKVNGEIINPAVATLTHNGVTTKYMSLQYALDVVSGADLPAGDYTITLLEEHAAPVSYTKRSGVNVSVIDTAGAQMEFPVSVTKDDVVTMCSSLQGAIDKASGSAGTYTITLLDDCAENVLLTQKEGVNITLTAANKTDIVFTGKIAVSGNKRGSGAETLTITGIKFDGSAYTDYYYPITMEYKKDPLADQAAQPHNITITHCDFVDDDHWLTAIRIRDGYGISISDCTQTGGFQFFWGDSCDFSGKTNTMTNVTVSGVTEGLSTGTSAFAFEKVTISADTHAIRLDLDTAYGTNNTLNNCTLTAPYPVVLRANTKATTVTIQNSVLNVSGGSAFGTPVSGSNQPIIAGHCDTCTAYMNKVTMTNTVIRYVLTVEAGTCKVSKVYDGTAGAGQASGELAVSGIQDGADVTVVATPRAYTDANVGGQSTILVDLTLSGSDAANYSLSSATVSVPCEITPATPTVTAWPTAKTVYVNAGTVGLNDDGAASVDGSFAVVEIDLSSAGEKTGTIVFTPSGGNYAPVVNTEYTVTVQKRPAPRPITYNITVEEMTLGGDVKASASTAAAGTTVTLTVQLEENFEMPILTVTDKSGKDIAVTQVSETKYTFVMPAKAVTITAYFSEKEIPVEPEKPEKPEVVMPFEDVPAEEYYYEAVEWAVEQNVTQGTSETTFSPEESSTRAQMVTFLWRAAGCPEPTITECPFADVDEDSYHWKAVLWALENGITTGMSDTLFGSDAGCTRAQMVTFLQRMYDGEAQDDESAFTDVDMDSYYGKAVQWAVENGITNGVSEDEFAPDAVCTRGQTVTFLWRAEN